MHVFYLMSWDARRECCRAARPKRLRFALFTLAARITSHAGSIVMKIGRSAGKLADLMASRLRLAELGAA